VAPAKRLPGDDGVRPSLLRWTTKSP